MWRWRTEAHHKCSLSTGTALITGASLGIGAVYADRLAERGYDLILVARDQPRLSALASGLVDKTGRTVEVLPAELTSRDDLLRVEARLRTDASITALVNNAGVGATGKPVDTKVNDLEQMIALNVTALTRLTAAVIPALLARGNGLLINIASIVALAPEMLNVHLQRHEGLRRQPHAVAAHGSACKGDSRAGRAPRRH